MPIEDAPANTMRLDNEMDMKVRLKDVHRTLVRPAGLGLRPASLEEQWSYAEAALFSATCGATHAAALPGSYEPPSDARPGALVHEIGDGRVDVADNHEARRRPHLAREQVDHQEVEADDDGAVGDGLDDGARSAWPSVHDRLLIPSAGLHS